MTEICKRQGKWIGGCKFEPRYDLSRADMSSFTEIRGGFNLEPLREKTYRGDVCVRCGKTVNEGK
jgi:hypothetical protein